MIALTLLAGISASAFALFIAGLMGTDLSFFESTQRGNSPTLRRWAPILVIATLAALVVIVLTEAVVGGLCIGAVIIGVPQLVEHRRSGKRELERIDAMAMFASQMAQAFGGGTGLAQTVIDASLNPPAAIYVEVAQLRNQLEASEFSTALEAFARNMGTPYAAKLAANLIAAEQEHATSLQQRLTRIAEGAQETAAISRLVRRERSQQSFQVKAITVILGIVVAGLLLSSPQIAKVFNDQIVGELRFGLVAVLALAAWLISERLDENVALEEFTLRTENAFVSPNLDNVARGNIR